MSRRKKYDKEFKLNALKLFEQAGKKQRDFERELGIGEGCLSHWKRELKDERENIFPGNGNPSDIEFAKLKRDNE